MLCRPKLRSTFSSCTCSIFHGVVATGLATYEVSQHTHHKRVAMLGVLCQVARSALTSLYGPNPEHHLSTQLARAWPVDVAATNAPRQDLVMLFSTVSVVWRVLEQYGVTGT